MSRKDHPNLIHTHIGPFGLYWLIRSVLATCRTTVENDGFFRKTAEAGKNMILVSWHNRLVILPHYYNHMYGLKNLTIMVSMSRDGEMFKRLLAKYDIECIRGSTTRGGRSAVKALIRETRKGRDTSIALDGSKGPRYIVQPGALLMAQMTGMPIVPITVAANRKYELNTWDRMIVPKMFARLHGIFAEPMYVPRHIRDLEPYRLQLQETMDCICTAAEERVR